MSSSLHIHRRSMEANSEASYCDRETWEDWESRSSLSHVEEVAPPRSEDIASLRAERDALARALSAERARSAAASRAHDARLAELHGVIAELVRRRARDKQSTAIPEEEVSDECESTTQPAGELDDNDISRTEQNESSLMSPCSLPTPQEKVAPIPDDTTDTSHHDVHIRLDKCGEQTDNCDTSINLSECASEPRCVESDKEQFSETRIYSASPGRYEARQAKIASRVKLRKTEEMTDKIDDDAWCRQAAEQLALDVCTQADRTEEALDTDNAESCSVCVSRGWRLAADVALLQATLQRTQDTAHRLYTACSVQEQACVAVCAALSAADRALETYDVLLALAETSHDAAPQRAAVELVGVELLSRLEHDDVIIGEPLLSPGPWLQHYHTGRVAHWTPALEARLRAHAARLKAATVALRPPRAPALFSYHDISEEDIPKPVNTFNMADMETAVLMQELLAAREARAVREARAHTDKHKCEGNRRKKKEKHWLHTQASETDL